VPVVSRMKLTDLHITKTLQVRGGEMCKETVREYAAAAEEGAAFPPLIAYRVSDRTFRKPALVAGFHRHAAYAEAGIADAEVEVRDGTFAEAWLAGYRSNLTNGLRYTNPQKRAAAETALLLYRDESARSVADMLGVSHDFIGKVRKELEAVGKLEKIDKIIARDGRQEPAKRKPSSESVSSDDTDSDADVSDADVQAAVDAAIEFMATSAERAGDSATAERLRQESAASKLVANLSAKSEPTETDDDEDADPDPLIDPVDAIDMAAALDSLAKAKKATKTLWHQIEQLLKSPIAGQLQRAARHHKLPFHRDEDAHQGVGEEAHVITAVRWPVIGQMQAMLADVTGQIHPDAETPAQRAMRRQHQKAAEMQVKRAQGEEESGREVEF
jgi:hypothetical protein